MAQVRNGHPSTAPPTTENEDCRRPKVRLRILPDGKHEHNLVSIWTEVAVAGNLRNLIKAKWRKRQGQQAEEVGGVLTHMRKPLIMRCKEERTQARQVVSAREIWDGQ